ncbi:hypothetical protein K492DRAFT_235475 [Lichtheimia hyalospora FSU 10163]|nr:hypothetical protein K492DRAFT_235475 [Lichtheimia hyalospora FSU 10163]
MAYHDYMNSKISDGCTTLSLSTFLKDNADKSNCNTAQVDWMYWIAQLKQIEAAKQITKEREALHTSLHRQQNRAMCDTLKMISKRSLPEAQASSSKRQAISSSHNNTIEFNQHSEAKAHISELLQWISEYKDLDSDTKKLLSLVDRFGRDNVLDLTSERFSSWNKYLIENTIRTIKFPYTITISEAYILAYVNQCKDLSDLEKLRRTLFQYIDVADGIEYMRTAIHHIILLWKSRKMERVNQESWWKQFVYTNLFDNAFLHMNEFDIKRSECASTIVDAFNTLVSNDIAPFPTHKTDFALRATDTGDDMLSGEDKPSHVARKEFCDAVVKNEKLRIMSTHVAKSQLPHPQLNTYFDALTTMWHGRRLMIDGTKEVDGRLIHYRAAECSIPLFPGDYPQLAKLLKVVLSLKQRIITTKKLLDTIKHTTMQLLLDDESGSRSPLYISSKDDSFELDEEAMVKLAALLPMDENERLRQYRKALDEELATNVNAKFADQKTIKEINSRSIKLVNVTHQLDTELAE